jgi:hypothetical protein
LNDTIQSLLELIPLIDIYFSERGLNLNWTTEAITQFKTSIRKMFSSELYLLIKEKHPLSTPDNKAFELSLTIEECMDKLLDPNISDPDRHTIESYMTSKFTISDLVDAKKR